MEGANEIFTVENRNSTEQQTELERKDSTFNVCSRDDIFNVRSKDDIFDVRSANG